MSDGRPRVVLALTPPAERAIEELLFAPEAPVVPAASVPEADELERLLDSGHMAVLLSPELVGMTAGHTARSRAAGLRIVGVALDEYDEQILATLGVDTVITPESSAEELLDAVVGERAEPPDSPQREQANSQDDRARERALVAVVGSKGAPGASECAASLAALAHRRWPTLLAELDAVGGALALRLGIEARQGSLLAVTRALAGGEPALAELVERWLHRHDGWPAVLPYGEPGEEAAALLAQPGGVHNALDALTKISPLCVIDVGFLLDEAGDPGRCCLIHREALVSADALVLVIGARDPQLEAGLCQLDLLLGPLTIRRERLRIVVNGLAGPGTVARSDLEQALLERLAARELTADAWLPWDGRALRRAQTSGLPLAIARPRGPYARALSRFLDQLFLPTAPVAQERKRKLPLPQRHEDEEVRLPWRS